VLAVALALIINIKRRYGTIEADEIEAMDIADRLAEFHAGAAADAVDDAAAHANHANHANHAHGAHHHG
jgi:hypothetical protein